MRKFLTVMMGLACLWSIFTGIKTVTGRMGSFGADFRLRYNEVKCVLEGTDPLFIWNGSVLSSVYKPFECKYGGHDEGLNLVHSYPPWSYTYLMPFLLFPRDEATIVYIVLQVICMLVLFGMAFRMGFVRKRRIPDGFLCLMVALCAFDPMMFCFRFLNYSILITGALLGMIVCLNRGYDVCAGFCWAYMMVKPQIALLFTIPLIMCGMWRTVVTAGIVCLLASIPPAILCGRSPIAMIFSIFEYSKGYGLVVDQEMALVPAFAAQLLLPIFSECGIMTLNAVLCIIGCGIATWFVRQHENWLYRFLPTVIFSVLWMVSRYGDLSCYIFFHIGVALYVLELLDKRDQVTR